MFVAQSAALALLFTPFFAIVLLYNLLDAIILTQYPGFSIEAHKKKIAAFERARSFPKVAIMIPAAGEAIEIVQKTLMAATKVAYPNYTTFLLDDSKEAIYRDIVLHSTGSYFRRTNTGYHKKAGNLNALLGKITNEAYDYVLVLDADFVPDENILKELMPYADPDVGIVQSPQHFLINDEVYKRSKFEYGAALIQRDFYRITQRARNRMYGAICVGTNALYNVKALEKVGGYEGVGRAEWGHSEDVNTGLKMINTTNEFGQRYRIEYVPVRLATGICPDDHLSFYQQQNRWATGSMQLMFSKKTLFSSNLTFYQKLCYLTNSTYYFYTIAILFSPLQLLVLLLLNPSFDWQSTLLFLPSLLIGTAIGPIALRRHFRPVASSLVMLSNAYTFAQAFFLLLIKRPLGWEATGSKSAKKRNVHFIHFKIFCSIFFIGTYMSVLVVLLMNLRLEFSPLLIISGLFLIAFISHLIYLHHMLLLAADRSKLHRDAHAYVYAVLCGIVLIVSVASLSVAGKYDVQLSRHTVVTLAPQPITHKENE